MNELIDIEHTPEFNEDTERPKQMLAVVCKCGGWFEYNPEWTYGVNNTPKSIQTLECECKAKITIRIEVWE